VLQITLLTTGSLCRMDSALGWPVWAGSMGCPNPLWGGHFGDGHGPIWRWV